MGSPFLGQLRRIGLSPSFAASPALHDQPYRTGANQVVFMVTRSAKSWDRPKAVLFDLDGTLYNQRILRKAMLRELARAPFTKGPFAAVRIAKTLRSFRLMREDLRGMTEPGVVLAELQFSRPAQELGVDARQVESTVVEWMFEKPLRHMKSAAWPGMRAALVALRDAGLRLGVYSDYPPDAKLGALGVDDLFEVTLGATDAEVNAFKPSPKGFLEGARALDADPKDVVYVGDRHDVDGMGAAAAGMRCVILETGMSHVGAVDSGSQGADDGTCRSILEFSEVPRAVGAV